MMRLRVQEFIRAAAMLLFVSGTVTFRNGAPAVNVLVVVGERSALTDVRGVYRLAGVQPGRQVIRVLKGGQPLVEKPVYIDPKASASTQNVSLP
ncbi:MAG: Carboxypeptidase regulatory-like domain [Bryobacterales bacterium]|nr:Carboxypeptidase regulatory-like domain [Bryobacterales bacterium]